MDAARSSASGSLLSQLRACTGMNVFLAFGNLFRTRQALLTLFNEGDVSHDGALDVEEFTQLVTQVCVSVCVC